jgi:membrane protease YdiL (CAAX protease family)
MDHGSGAADSRRHADGVGFAEEIVFRGYLLVGARARFTEVGAWFATSALFALIHGLNILTGQNVGTTVQQIVLAFIMGSGLYLIRRVSGLLAAAMVIHGLWDFASFIGAGRGEDTGGIPGTIAAAPFTWGAVIVTVATLVVLFRRGTHASTPAT